MKVPRGLQLVHKIRMDAFRDAYLNDPAGFYSCSGIGN